MSLEPRKCAKCPAPIVWAISAKTGARMPIDAAPSENGNVLLKKLGDNWVAHVLGAKDAEESRALGQSLHVSHFVTCPFSRDFRKAKR